jgi:hypothetical protein
MNAPLRHAPSSGFADLVAGLFWPSDAKVLIMWGYHEESGEYDATGRLLNMTLGGCWSPADKWLAFDMAWAKVLRDEGLAWFHMTDFEAWEPPFDFTLPDGSRDKERHNRILNSLLGIMLDHIEGFYAFGATLMFDPDAPVPPPKKAHFAQMEDCVCGAIKHAVLEAFDFYETPVHLVYAKQRHFPVAWIQRYVDFYDYGDATGRVKSFTMADVRDIRPLQGADIWAYEAARAQRPDRPLRYPYLQIIEGCKRRGLRNMISWGPVRSYKLNLASHPISSRPGAK